MSLTAKKVAESSGIDLRLVRGVLRQVGGGKEAWDTLRDVCRGGADAGFCGFTYYKDTVAFFKRYRSEINSLAERMAVDLGENVSDMVAGFNCLAGRELKREHTGCFDDRARAHNRAVLGEYLPSVNKCLYGGRLSDDDTTVANALAWFALEEVARAADDCED